MRRCCPPLIMLVLLLVGARLAWAQAPDQILPPGTPKAVVAPQPAQPPAPPQPPQPPEPGQAPQAAPVPQPRPALLQPPPLPKPPGLPVNVKIELTITDQFGSAPPVQKTVSLLVADRANGMIRSEGMLPGYGKVQLHVDGEVQIITQSEGKIRTQIGLFYDLIDPKAAAAERQSQTTQIRESLNTVLDNGKPMTLSQSADPVTDRRVTVEVKATIMK